MPKHSLVPESCSAGAASTKRCVTESIIVFSIGFTTAGTMSSTDSPCGTFGPETWHTDILLKSALQDHSCSFSFKWLDTSWKNPQPRALEQVIGNGPNPVFCSSGLMYRDNAKWSSKTAVFSASIYATSFHLSEVRCLAFDSNPCCFVHYDHDNYDDGWPHAMSIVHPRHEDQN